MKNNKTVIVAILCIIGMITIIGYTYSFFAAEVSNAVTIKGDAASPSVNLTISRVAPTEDKKLIPQLDAVIHKAVIGTQGNCLDDNHNAVCQVYKITVTNTSTVATYINGKIELDAKDNPHLKWAEVSGLSNTTLVSDVKLHSETILTSNELYEGGEVKDYYVVVWISEIGIAQTDSGSFNGTVTIENIASNPALATLTRLGITPEDEILTTFNRTSKSDGTTGVYASDDDLGTSYYFRGNVTNNYVKFGKYTEDAYQIITSDETPGEYIYSYDSVCPSNYAWCDKIASANDDMYWRIVRINGDGTIRMMYAGTEAYLNGDFSSVAQKDIGVTPYNNISNDNAYVGYMYGTPGSTTYEETHANINDSDLKKTIDAWYAKYLNTNYNSYVADAIYCNDRTISNNDLLNEFYEVTNEGFGTYPTLYGYIGKTIINENATTEEEVFHFVPSLKCEQVNDRFTQNATVGKVAGNGKLTYPIGTITADEVMFLGFITYIDGFSTPETVTNDETYFYHWDTPTMSPFIFDSSSVKLNIVIPGLFGPAIVNRDFLVDIENNIDFPTATVVISLKTDAITGGSGIATDPFTVG